MRRGRFYADLYDVWRSMIKSGAEIKPEWLRYRNFRNWATSNGFPAARRLMRKNESLNYEPGNCYFAAQ
jgi:hypothetical protein